MHACANVCVSGVHAPTWYNVRKWWSHPTSPVKHEHCMPADAVHQLSPHLSPPPPLQHNGVWSDSSAQFLSSITMLVVLFHHLLHFHSYCKWVYLLHACRYLPHLSFSVWHHWCFSICISFWVYFSTVFSNFLTTVISLMQCIHNLHLISTFSICGECCKNTQTRDLLWFGWTLLNLLLINVDWFVRFPLCCMAKPIIYL